MLSELINSIITLVSNPYIIIIILTLFPFLELRASIPYGIFATNISIPIIFILTVITNIILAPILYFILYEIIHLFFFIKPFAKWYHKKLEKTQKKIKDKFEKYEILGLAVFIGIPLPGSGVYTGAIAAYLMNLGYKKFLLSATIGVIIAAVVVTTISLLADSGIGFLSSLFLKQI